MGPPPEPRDAPRCPQGSLAMHQSELHPGAALTSGALRRGPTHERANPRPIRLSRGWHRPRPAHRARRERRGLGSACEASVRQTTSCGFRFHRRVADAGADRKGRIPREARIGLGQAATPEGAPCGFDAMSMAAGDAQSGPVGWGGWWGRSFHGALTEEAIVGPLAHPILILQPSSRAASFRVVAAPPAGGPVRPCPPLSRCRSSARLRSSSR